MNKKLVFSSIGVALLSAVAVHAADTSSVSSLFKFLEDNILKFILIDIAGSIGQSFYIWMKVMLFLLLFSLIFALASIGPIANNVLTKKNIRVMVSVLISLISVIMIPNAMVEAIAKTYGFIGSFIFIGLPVLGIVYALYKGFPTGPENDPAKNRVNHIIKGVLFFLLATVIHNFMAASALSPGWSNVAGWIEWGSLAEGVCMLMMLWHFGSAIFSFGAETETGERVGDWWSNLGREREGRAPYPSHLRKFINAIGSSAIDLERGYRTYKTKGDKILTANAAGNPVDPADVQEMRRLMAEFNGSLQVINNSNIQIRNDPQFNELSAGERNKLAQQLTKSTLALINIYRYTNEFFDKYSKRLPPK